MWHYAKDGRQIGPVDQRTFDGLIATGGIGPGTLVWREGMDAWRPAHEEIASLRGALPPGLPDRDAALPTMDGTGPDTVARSGFGHAVRDGFTRYATFSQRSTRSEFWWFSLAMVLGGLATTLLDAALFGNRDIGLINGAFSLATFLPALAVAIRRLHDIGKSGWWYLLIFVPVVGWIILIVWYCQPSQPHANQWGVA